MFLGDFTVIFTFDHTEKKKEMSTMVWGVGNVLANGNHRRLISWEMNLDARVGLEMLLWSKDFGPRLAGSRASCTR